MNIDFHILLKWLSVTFMRSGFDVFLKPISDVFTNLYTSIKVWKKDAMLQAAITCQVMYMELIINYRLFGNYNRTVYITDGDQTTVDFIVNVPIGVTYNVQLLIGLLEKYKATGKRYTIEQQEFTYDVRWTNFVCEKVVEEIITYDTRWTDFVCEKALIYNPVSIHIVSRDFEATTPYNVTSTVSVVVKITYNNGMTYTTSGSIVIGQNSSGVISGQIPGDYSRPIQSIELLGVSPETDSTYIYYQNGGGGEELP